MTRLVGTTFAGVPVYDAQPEAPTKRTTMTSVFKDEAMVRDIVTGDNTPPLTLEHTGEAVSGQAGCLLGFPLTQLQAAGEGDHSLASGATAGTETRFVFVPWYKPVGETSVTVAFHGTGGFGYRLELYNTSGSIVAQQPFTESNDGGLVTYFARLQDLTADPGSGSDQLYFLAVAGPTQDLFRQIYGLRIFYRIGGPAQARGPEDAGTGNPVTVPSTASGGATVADFTDIDSGFIGDTDNDGTSDSTGYAIDGYTLTKVSQNQNALAERLTGAPAGSNDDLTLVDSGTEAPSTSAFLDGSQAGKANEAEWGMPLMTVAYGSIPADGSHNNGAVTKRYAPGLKTLSVTTAGQAVAHMPHKPNGASSKLRACALICAPDGGLFAGPPTSTVVWAAQIWDAATLTSQDVNTSSTWTQIGSTYFAYMEWTAVDFAPDELALIADRYDASVLKAATGDSFRVCGTTFHFEV